VNPVPELNTARLRLRAWRASDREPFAAMNADPRVMEHFAARLSRQESDHLAARIVGHFEAHGFGLWAVEILGVTPFAGFIGLAVPRFEARFTPCVEVGWRLSAEHWGCGYASEGARAALTHGFDVAGLAEIVSFTTPGNLRSRRVMDTIGMTHDPADDFDHPEISGPLQRHVLYRVTADGFRDRASGR
jgi:RimJ/RimL family protein N-acetyltransferase